MLENDITGQMSNVSTYSGLKLNRIDKEIDRLPQPRDERAKGLPHQPGQKRASVTRRAKNTAYIGLE
jgi:hypothetical protein